MKYAIIIPDGCADESQESLGGRTPLEVANVQAMDTIVRDGLIGQANNVPLHLSPGSDVATMSLLGYDPTKHFTGRAPLEAAAQGIDLAEGDWAIRCNLVTIRDQVMCDFTAGHISTEQATQLLDAAQQQITNGPWEFRSGVSYRNLLLYRAGHGPAPFSEETRTTPPHDLTNQNVADDFPRGPGSDLLCDVMNRSVDIFAEHPANRQRTAAGKLPATNVWLWGIGSKPVLPAFAELYGKQAVMITAVDLLRGLAKLIGWQQVDVPGATGYTDTDYAAKGRYAIEALTTTDLVCVHIEATDEASHEGDTEAKIKALEEIDRHIVKPLHDALRKQGDYRILVSPDHPTLIRTKTHSHGPVPLAISGTGIQRSGASTYDERSAAGASLAFDEGWKMMSFFLG